MSVNVRQTAKCHSCTEKSLGAPIKVVKFHGKHYTLYECDCGQKWHRPHQPEEY